MAEPTRHETEHETKVLAPARAVYDLLADVTNWPRMFPPSVHIDRESLDGHAELIHIWATANGEVKSWTSRRDLDPDGLRIRFRQQRSQPPVAGMGGEWIVEPISENESLVRLLHDFTAVDDDPDAVTWITSAIDRNSEAELSSLRDVAENQDPAQVLTFTDEVRVDGAASDVYDFLKEADKWPERLPHVDDVTFVEDAPGIQSLTMVTRTADGSTHSTHSVRVARACDRIVYKQLQVPALMSVHAGCWDVVPDGDGVLVRSSHTVVVRTENIEPVLGEGKTLDDARAFLRNALGRNSTTTMEAARAYAEARRPVDAETYASVQQFYARHMHLLDDGEAERWANTFTEDGEFVQNAKPRPMSGRADIAVSMRRGLDKVAASGLTRRHWVGMLRAMPGHDGSVRTRYYAMVLSTPKGGAGELYLSTDCEDVLVPDGSGSWLVRHRLVKHDDV